MNGATPASSTSSRVHADELLVRVRVEQRARDAVRAGHAGLALDRLDDDDARRRPRRARSSYGSPSAASRSKSLIGGVDVAICSSSTELSSRKSSSSCPSSARSVVDQPSYCLSSRPKRCQRVSVSLSSLPSRVEDDDLLELVAEQDLLELGLLLDVALGAAVLDLVERRLGDVDVAGLDELRHLAEQQRQHERPDVRAVHVGVGHDDDLVVARVLDVELVAHAGAERGDERLDLVVLQDLVDPALLDVEDLAAQRQDGLGRAVAPLRRRAAGGVALDDEDLGERRVLDLAVARACPAARCSPARDLRRVRSRALRAAARAWDAETALRMIALAVLRVLLEELVELRVDDRAHEALHAGVAELRLRLALELRVGELRAR